MIIGFPKAEEMSALGFSVKNVIFVIWRLFIEDWPI